jgi:phage shock protein E
MSLWNMLFGGGSAGVEKVDGARARALVAEGAVLLDVRSPSEFAGVHIEGALNIPVDQLAGRLGEVPEGAVVIYCRSGRRSARAARVLAGAEREGVHDLGGMGAW